MQAADLGIRGNLSGASWRTRANIVDQALATESLGPTAPTTTYPSMRWWDTSANLIKRRTLLNDAWNIEGSFTPTGVVTFYNAGLPIQAISTVKHNITASTDPTPSTGTGLGYSIGSIWINQSLYHIFMLARASSGSDNLWLRLDNAAGAETSYLFLRSAGADSPPVWAPPLIQLGEKALSGSTVTFSIDSISTSLSAIVREIDIVFWDASLTGNEDIIIQLGTGPEAAPAWITSGYTGRTINQHGSETDTITFTNGFRMDGATDSVRLVTSPSLRLTRTDTQWHCGGTVVPVGGASTRHVGGYVPVTGVTRFRIAPFGLNVFSTGRIRARALL